MDIALVLQEGGEYADLILVDDDLATDEGLATAVLLSLFPDRRAEDDDTLPSGEGRRGWWGDQFAEAEGDLQGSRLWLLERGTADEGLAARAEEYAAEALQWLLDDGVADTVEAVATVGNGRLDLVVTVIRPSGERADFTFENIWNGVAGYAV